MSRASRITIATSTILWFCMTPTVSQAERIFLRSLRSVDKSVVAFDPDGIRFEDNTELGWDEIKAGTVKPSDQRQFDEYLKTLGEDLYRVRVRLQNRDYKDLRQSAEKLAPVYASRQSKTAYTVNQSLMWSRLADGKPASAVAPYLRCYAYLRDNKKLTESIPGDRQLQFDPATGMTSEILPIWFDKEDATTAFAELGETIRTLSKPIPPGARIYFGTMAIAAGQNEAGDRVLASLGQPTGKIGEWVLIARASQELQTGKGNEAMERLRGNVDRLQPETQPAARYLIGCDHLRGENVDRDEGLLELLKLIAIHGDRHPELAAASHAAAIEALQVNQDGADDANAKRMTSILRREMLRAYPSSYHAQKLTQSLNVAEDDP